MSTMHSIQSAFRRNLDEGGGGGNKTPVWLIAILVVTAVAVVVGLADLGLLPSYAADDMTSLLFCSG